MVSNVIDNNTADAFIKLHNQVAGELEAVDAKITERLFSHIKLIPEISGHIVSSGGKRIRPMLTLACAKLCGYEGERHIGLASCVELIHTATLLHDDVIDESKLRRGKACANIIWGNKESILVGDFLLSRSFEFMVEDGSIEVLRILSNASSVISSGEILQLTIAGNLDASLDDYLEVIRSKTAALFSAACEVGAVISDSSNEKQQALQNYGTNLGIAFQLADDILDYSTPKDGRGKQKGDDFREGKITLPIVLTYNEASDAEKAFLSKCFSEHIGLDDNDTFNKCCDLIAKYNGLDKTIKLAQSYAEKAKNSLQIFSENGLKNNLIELVDFCVKRAF